MKKLFFGLMLGLSLSLSACSHMGSHGCCSGGECKMEKSGDKKCCGDECKTDMKKDEKKEEKK